MRKLGRHRENVGEVIGRAVLHRFSSPRGTGRIGAPRAYQVPVDTSCESIHGTGKKTPGGGSPGAGTHTHGTVR